MQFVTASLMAQRMSASSSTVGSSGRRKPEMMLLAKASFSDRDKKVQRISFMACFGI
jgi:hypothetical protein